MILTFRGKRILHLLIIFHLNQSTSAFKIIDVEDLPKPRLELIGQNFENNFVFKDNPPEYSSFLDYNEKENGNLKHKNGFNNLNVEDNGFKNKILVKRKLPHGIAPTGVEYDQKFDSVYKPLVRIHKIKSMNQFLNEMTPNKDSKHGRVIFVLPNKPNYNKFKPNHDLNDEHLIKPNVFQNSLDFNDKSKLLKLIHDRIKNIKEPSKHNFEFENKRVQFDKALSLSNAFEISEKNLDNDDYKLKLLKEVENKKRDVKSRSKRLIAFAKALNVLNAVLRSPQLEMSGEAHDPLAPGQQTLEKDDKQKQPKKWIPHYPPWNYWTYKKTIYEDECPGTQVKIGNMCIYTPPH